MTSDLSIEDLNSISKNTLIETLQIKFIEVSENKVVATMPVNSKVHQPDGVLHGGASVALAETVGSMAALISTNNKTHMVRGIEISANHISSVRSGLVTAVGTPIHKGRTTQLWQIKISDAQGKLVSICKLTTITLAKNNSQ